MAPRARGSRRLSAAEAAAAAVKPAVAQASAHLLKSGRSAPAVSGFPDDHPVVREIDRRYEERAAPRLSHAPQGRPTRRSIST